MALANEVGWSDHCSLLEKSDREETLADVSRERGTNGGVGWVEGNVSRAYCGVMLWRNDVIISKSGLEIWKGCFCGSVVYVVDESEKREGGGGGRNSRGETGSRMNKTWEGRERNKL